MSLLPTAFGMPMRITANHGTELKKYGVHNGARCRFRGWDVHPADASALQSCKEPEIVLKYMPTKLFVEMLVHIPTYNNLPKNWVAIPISSSHWTLSRGGDIEIQRRGFALVPDFSSTIHVATGRSLEGCIADLGGFSELPSFTDAGCFK